MEERSSTTSLPPVRRVRRRDWGRIVARVLCVLFAVSGLVPLGLGLLVRTTWARGIATRETRALVAAQNVDASYDLELHLWPLSVTLSNLRVEATDGGTPFFAARRVSARPKIFGLLAGKVVIDQIEIERPSLRAVVRDGKLQNLAVELPESKKDDAPSKPPFSVVSASEGDIDVEVDGVRVSAHEIDADVATDEGDHGGTAFELALRVSEARTRRGRAVPPAEGAGPSAPATDEDTFCHVDGRARIEQGRILVRRLSAYGAADLDPAEGTALGCDLSKDDARYVDLAIGHFSVVLPKGEGGLPSLDGHVHARAPLALIDRLPDAPLVAGWAMVDAELRLSTDTPLPDVVGHLEVHGVRVDKFNFARSIKSEFLVSRSVVTSPLTTVEIAEGVAEIRDVEVRPLERGVPIKVGKLDARDVDFTALMQDLGVSPHPHVTWDLREVHASTLHGSADPLRLDGDLVAHTANFAVFDAAVTDPARTRAVGVKEGHIVGKVAVRPTALEFHNVTVTTPKSTVTGVLVSIGFHEVLRVEVPKAQVNLADLSPLGSIPMAGVTETSAVVSGTFDEPRIEGDTTIQNFVLGDLPFGNVTQAHISADIDQLVVDLKDVRAQKGKSTYEMPTGRLDFKGPATMKLDAQVTSKNLDVRDFFNVFKLDEDPRFEEIEGTLSTSARMHLALGGPEDVCKGGYLDVQATTDARNLNLLGERFDEGHADFEYRWIDRMAGVAGAEIDVRSLSLTKAKKEGRAAVGSVLGSLSVHRADKASKTAVAGGDLRGNLVLQGFPLARADLLGPVAKNLEGSVSGVARLGGTLGAFTVEADLNVTPVRVLGAPFGGSDVHVVMTQNLLPQKVIGKSPCGLPVTAPFDKEAYLRDASLQGEYRVSGALFGGQVKLEDIVLTRQKAPVLTGRVRLAGFDLGPVGRMLVSGEGGGDGTMPLGGEISGDLVLDRIPVTDLSRAKATFSPKTMRVTRGGQRIELRPETSVVTFANGDVTLPQMTFDLAVAGGLKGAVTIRGGVKNVTTTADLAIDANLSPIDLGLLVGMVPRVTRAVGTLSGSIRLSGRARQPEFDGKLHVRGGELGIKGVPGAITDIELDVAADENEARVTRGAAHFLGGDVGLTARAPLKSGQLGVAQAFLTGRHLSLAPVDGVRATVDCDLEISLNPQASTPAGRLPFVGGEVNVTSFEYTRPITIDLTGLRGGARRTTIEAYDPSLDAVALGFYVRSRSPLRIRNNLIDAQLSIDPRGIHVTGTNQRIGLRGELTTLPGGRFRVFANDFEVQKASIRFDDATRIAPNVDILATTEYRRYSNTATTTSGANTTGGAGATSGNISSGGRGGGLWRISLHAYGDTEDLKVDMTSDPALSREDIFFLLTIGLTRAEVDQVKGGSVYASAAFEALGTVSGADRAVKTAIPVIDDFRFGSAYSPRTGRTEPQVTLGRRLTQNVRANVSTGLTEDRQLRSNIEWRLSRPLSVQTSYDNISTVSSGSIGNFGLDFRWRLEFD